MWSFLKILDLAGAFFILFCSYCSPGPEPEFDDDLIVRCCSGTRASRPAIYNNYKESCKHSSFNFKQCLTLIVLIFAHFR